MLTNNISQKVFQLIFSDSMCLPKAQIYFYQYCLPQYVFALACSLRSKCIMRQSTSGFRRTVTLPQLDYKSQQNIVDDEENNTLFSEIPFYISYTRGEYLATSLNVKVFFERSKQTSHYCTQSFHLRHLRLYTMSSPSCPHPSLVCWTHGLLQKGFHSLQLYIILFAMSLLLVFLLF